MMFLRRSVASIHLFRPRQHVRSLFSTSQSNPKQSICNLQNPPKGGDLFIWSGSTFTNSSDLKPIPIKLVSPDGIVQTNKIAKVVMGSNVMAILTTNGEVYTQGEGKYGALGHNDGKDCKNPRMLEFFAKKNLKVIDIVCGSSFMIALTSDGDVWTWGWGGKQRGFLGRQFFSYAGALAHGDQKHVYSPQPVQALRSLPRITAISSGLYAGFALNAEKEFYYWGRGQHGSFGDGYSKDLLVPRLSNYFDVIKKTENITISSFKSCNYFSVAQLSNGQLVGWGSNDHGQMGINNEIGVELHETSPYPSVVHTENLRNNSAIVDYELGEDVLVMRLENGEIYFSGMKLSYLPKRFALPEDAAPIKLLGAAFRSFAVVDENNRIYMKNKFVFPNLGENIKTGVYSADNSCFDKGEILAIGGSYRNHFAIIRR